VIPFTWKNRAGLVLLGALSALAFPPTDLVFILWLCLPLLVRSIDGSANWKGAFGRAWLFGLGHFAAGLYWIACALLVDPVRFGWMIPFAIGGLSAFLAIYIGLAAALARLVRPGWPRLLVFAAAWGGMEWLRGLLFTGFHWNPLGSAWAAVTPVLQIVSVIGTFGLGLVTVAAAAAPGLFFRSRREGAVATLLGFVLFAAIGIWGQGRIPVDAQPTQPGIRLRLVQASIPQTLKWVPSMRVDHFRRQAALTRSPAESPPTHVIWPETAAPSFLDEDPGARQAMASLVPPGGLMLVGVLRGTPEGVEPVQEWNSLQMLDDKGDIVGQYDKAHLVPFGEYVPLPKWLPLAKITVGSIAISPGPGPQTLQLPGLPPVGPLICYEAIFPGAIIDETHRPDWMLNVTNDGWYGNSSGPYQHFAAARMRAIEEGLPLVRNANNGISAVIDPYGRVIARLGLNEVGVVDAPLPTPIDSTIFARMGSGGLCVLLMITAGAGLLGHLFGRRQAP
jgi:apolipoprotein N-acyltransferase